MEKVKLVDNWTRLYKSWTMILTGLGAIANLVMGGMMFLNGVVDANTLAYVNFTLFILVGIARMVKQPSLTPKESEPSEGEVS